MAEIHHRTGKRRLDTRCLPLSLRIVRSRHSRFQEVELKIKQRTRENTIYHTDKSLIRRLKRRTAHSIPLLFTFPIDERESKLERYYTWPAHTEFTLRMPEHATAGSTIPTANIWYEMHDAAEKEQVRVLFLFS